MSQEPLTEDQRKAYELYLLAGNNDAQIKQALSLLVEGSEPYRYLYFLDKLKKDGLKGLTESDKTYLSQIKFKDASESERCLYLRNLLLSYDDCEDPDKRKTNIDLLLDAASRFRRFDFNCKKAERAGIKQDEDTIPNEDEIKKNATLDESKWKVKARGDLIAETLTNMLNQQELMIESAKTNDHLKRNLEGSLRQLHFESIQFLVNNNTHDSLEHELDFILFRSDAVHNWVCQGQKIPSIQNPTLFQSIGNYINTLRTENPEEFKYFTCQFARYLTVEQMDKLVKIDRWFLEDEDFIGAQFQKTFCLELSEENQELWSTEEKLQNLERLYNYAKEKNLPKTLQLEFLEQILTLGPKIGTHSKQYFKEMLTLTDKKEISIFNDYKPKDHTQQYQRQKAVTNWQSYCGNVITQTGQSRSSPLYKSFLLNFCEEAGGSLSEFANEFTKEFLRDLEKQVKVFTAHEGFKSLDQSEISLAKFKELSDMVILEFCKSNKEQFLVEEDVSLHLSLKNISQLHVKVFEFNTETYYKKNLQPINKAVNLDGLEASEQLQFNYEQPSNIKFKKTFSFPQLMGRVGLFIVEFIGNGVSARAVIKKGSLSLVHRSTIAGHLLYILDDKKQICAGDRTGVWFDGKFYQAEKEKGRILMPYGQQNLSAKIIMINGEFAQIGDFQRRCEEYQFNAKFFLQQESVLVGSSTSLIVRPQFTINGRAANLSMLNNVKLTITTMNYIDRTPITRNFENLSFEEGKELTVQFQIPMNLESISTSLTAEVQNVTTKKMNQFNASHTFQIFTQSNTNQMSDAYLRKVQGEYHVLLLGKNGEAVDGQKVSVQIKHRICGLKGDFDLVTDQEGEIHLGKLEDVVELYFNPQGFSEGVFWQLELASDAQNWTFPQRIEILEAESISLPINLRAGQTKLDRKWLSIVRYINGVVIDDCFDNVKLEKVNDYHTILLAGLQQGDYQMTFLSGHQRVSISVKVNSGTYWEGADGFILKKHSLQENIQRSSIVKIAKVEIEKGDNTHLVTVKLDDFSKSVHVHAFATQFVPNDQLGMVHQIEIMQKSAFSASVFPFAKWENYYDSNRAMADEIRYVFDRKQLESQLGNTLDRPTLLLNKTFVRKTATEDEVLNAGASYKNEVEQVQQFANRNMMMTQNCMPQSYSYDSFNGPPLGMQPPGAPYAQFGGAGGRNMNYPTSTTTTKQQIRGNSISEFQNYLKCPPIQKLNMKPEITSEEAVVKFNCNLTPYTQLTIIVVDSESVAMRAIQLETFPIQKRDLRLLKVLDKCKGLTEARQALPVSASSESFIEDIINTEVQMIDDLNKVSEILKEIRKVQGEGEQLFKDFGFIKKWLKLSAGEKDGYYSEFCCNELNIFIKNKDPSYFRNTVKPFLQCKMEKLFVDHYLLENNKQVMEYAQTHLIKQLNALEQCMLVDVLCRAGDIALAGKIAERMQLFQDANGQKGQEKVKYDKQIFDIVLNLNTLNDVKGVLSQFKQNKEKEARDKEEKQIYSQTTLFDDCDDDDDCMDFRTESLQAESVQFSAKACSMSRKQVASPKASKMMSKMSAMPQRNQMMQLQEMSYLMNQRDMQLEKQGFEELEQTSEYMETHYYKQTDVTQYSFLISQNQFWCDLAKHYATPNHGSFMTSAFTANSANDRESFLAICFLDLLQDASEAVHEFKPNENVGVTIKAQCNLILYRREIKECEVALKNDVMVIHRYHVEHQSQEESFEEFLAKTTYECEVIITNVSPKVKQFNLLYQIPQGSMPMKNSKQMKCENMTLQPFTTNKLTFHFYFPTVGKFSHFPSNVSIDGIVISRGGANQMTVVKSRRITKIETFNDLLIAGTQQDILNYLTNESLFSTKKGFSFYSIGYLLKDRQFFDKVIAILRERCIFEQSVWQFAFFFKDDTALMNEALKIQKLDKEFTSMIGCFFKSGLLDTEEVESVNFVRHLEYHPMVNKRAHIVGKNAKIQNVTFRNTYDSFLKTMVQKPSMSVEDKLSLVYYLQLQDRFQAAIDLLKTIPEPQSSTPFRIQYDYLQAYFDFFGDKESGYKTARRIVMQYDNYPVASWRMMFLAIQDQLNEFDGEFDNAEEMASINTTDEELKLKEQRKQNKKTSQRREPSISSVEVDKNGTLKVESVNLLTLSVQYYIINAELLFSRQPFLKDNTEGFSYVKPYHTLTHCILSESADEQQLNSFIQSEIVIPDKLKNQNMVLEIKAGDTQKFLTFYSNQLKVTVLEQYGELKVNHLVSGVPLPKSYVKVFSKTNSGEVFYRDGYTDIRGKFEYSQTSGDKLKDVTRFAILVQNDKYGSKILECAPPKGVTGTGADSFVGQKQARLENRQNYCKLQKK